MKKRRTKKLKPIDPPDIVAPFDEHPAAIEMMLSQAMTKIELCSAMLVPAAATASEPVDGDYSNVLSAMERAMEDIRRLPVAIIAHFAMFQPLRQFRTKEPSPLFSTFGLPMHWYIFDHEIPRIAAGFAGRLVLLVKADGSTTEVEADELAAR